MDTTYLQLKKRTWFVQLRVPRELVPVIGKQHLWASTKTRSLSEAVRRKYRILADMHKLLDAAREALRPGTGVVDDVITSGSLLRQKVRTGQLRPAEAWSEWEHHLDRLDWVDHIPAGEAGLIKQAGVALLEPKAMLSETIEDYLDDCAGLKPQTIHNRRRRLTAFLTWSGDVPVAKLTAPYCSRYVSEVLAHTGWQPTSIKLEIADLSSYANWCVLRGLLQANPFRGLYKLLRGATAPPKAPRRPWTQSELYGALRRSHGHLRAGGQVLLVLGMYTGARLGELANLRCADVTDSYFTITRAKTTAGRRSIPWHPVVRPLVKTLLDSQSNDYLIPWHPIDDRTRSMGSAFSKFKRGLQLPPEVTFHGLRHTFVQQLVDRSWPEADIMQIVGHRAPQLIRNTYSRGVPMARLQEVVGSVDYGPEVTEEVADISQRLCQTPLDI